MHTVSGESVYIYIYIISAIASVQQMMDKGMKVIETRCLCVCESCVEEELVISRRTAWAVFFIDQLCNILVCNTVIYTGSL